MYDIFLTDTDQLNEAWAIMQEHPEGPWSLEGYDPESDATPSIGLDQAVDDDGNPLYASYTISIYPMAGEDDYITLRLHADADLMREYAKTW